MGLPFHGRSNHCQESTVQALVPNVVYVQFLRWRLVNFVKKKKMFNCMG